LPAIILEGWLGFFGEEVIESKGLPIMDSHLREQCQMARSDTYFTILFCPAISVW
jgi:hypothetical protein